MTREYRSKKFGDDNADRYLSQEMQVPQQSGSKRKLALDANPNKIDEHPYDYIDDGGRPRSSAQFGSIQSILQETKPWPRMDPRGDSETRAKRKQPGSRTAPGRSQY